MLGHWNESLEELRNDIIAEEVINECEYKTPCDYPDENGEYHCPYDAQGGDACRCYCGLGVDE